METVGHIALRNFKVRFRPSSRIVGDFGECIQREDGWVKLWNDVGLADIVLGPSRMAVNKDNLSNWNVASNHLRTAQDYTTQSYYQWRRGNTLYSIRFLMQDQFGDVYAKIASAHYNYDDNGSHPEYVPGYNPGTSDGAGTSFVAVTNVVNAEVAGAHDTLMIEHLTADVVAKKRHSVAVGADFNSGSSPVRLDSIKLALEPQANEEMTFCADVRGCGVVGVSGAGSVKLAADLPVNVGLDVDSGTAVIDSARRLEGNVSVKSGATLEFLFAPGRPDPLLEADSLSLEEGAVVAVDVERMIADSSEPMTYKLVSGCNYAEYALDGVSFVLTGRLRSVYKPEFFVDDDGDIAFRATRIKGFVMIIR